ncbi:DNA-nicking Smr family endonuclease [Fluviicoccus keumensis]|uniref:DNA-nicking Smr family endonuclease n=1 Tax=Fluviicoccus keumensis TaxID=1435465 RepID=A0A4Q7Z974_9GAMM|nr:Smr/MutS family protein [Fluviicoccus keumensis]RZU47072.1 DNA-nicking Smr family endonuclease [Fluviicoccus keumensis]
MKSKLLNDLKKSLASEQKPVIKVAPVTVAKPEETDEKVLWQRALTGVKPLETEATAPLKMPRPDKQEALMRRARAEGDRELDNLGISDTQALLNPVASEAQLAFRRVGVQVGQFKKLQDGQLPWKAAVDLHGCTVEQARLAVLQLIADAREESITIIKIVHGKGYSQETGGSLLKTCVNGWLQQHPAVLAFCSASSKDGGTGAVLVLLKRQPPPTDSPRQ